MLLFGRSDLDLKWLAILSSDTSKRVVSIFREIGAYVLTADGYMRVVFIAANNIIIDLSHLIKQGVEKGKKFYN